MVKRRTVIVGLIVILAFCLLWRASIRVVALDCKRRLQFANDAEMVRQTIVGFRTLKAVSPHSPRVTTERVKLEKLFDRMGAVQPSQRAVAESLHAEYNQLILCDDKADLAMSSCLSEADSLELRSLEVLFTYNSDGQECITDNKGP